MDYVCTQCFEIYGRSKKKVQSLLDSNCLQRSDHKDGNSVRVRLTEEGTLEPEIRPTPNVHFRGEFVLCEGGPKCKGLKCIYPHCLKEKAAWNADKYGLLAGSASYSTTNAEMHQEPWPHFPGFGALTSADLEQNIQSKATVDEETMREKADVSFIPSSQPVLSETSDGMTNDVQPPQPAPSAKSSPRTPAQTSPSTQPEVSDVGSLPWMIPPELPVFTPKTKMSYASAVTSQNCNTKQTHSSTTVPPVKQRFKGHKATSHKAKIGQSHQAQKRQSRHINTPKQKKHRHVAPTPPKQRQSYQVTPPQQKWSHQVAPLQQEQSRHAPTSDQRQFHQVPILDQRQVHTSDQRQSHQVPTSDQKQSHQVPTSDQRQSHQVPISDQNKSHQVPTSDQRQSLPTSDQRQSHQVPTSDQKQSHQVPTPQQKRSHQEATPHSQQPQQVVPSQQDQVPTSYQRQVHQIALPQPRQSLQATSSNQRQSPHQVSLAHHHKQLAHSTRGRSMKTDGGPMKRKAVHRTTRSTLHETLAISNYCLRFNELLKHEKESHKELLSTRCDGEYIIFLCQLGQTPGELKVDAKPGYHARYGYIKGMGCDEVAYATQSASCAIIKLGNRSTKCDILRENNYHAEERLYIAFEKENVDKITSYFKIDKNSFESLNCLLVNFLLKFSYFKSLQESIDNMEDDGIARIIPKHSSFKPTMPLDHTLLEPYIKYCSPDQLQALKTIASTPVSGPPTLIAGPFGTGKTRVLAVAAHYFVHESVQKSKRVGILVCAQQQTSADAFFEMYSNLTLEKEPVTVTRVVPRYVWRPNNRCVKSVEEFKKEMERNSHRNLQRYVIVTTCLTAKQIANIIPSWFFTHIFLDEGAQMREPEAVAPLCMASPDTKLVIAGDKYQVGPSMLVLGEKPQKHGLSKSLLERLYDLYHELGEVAMPYIAHLSTNFRCHRAILNLAQQIAYKMPLKCEVKDHTAHPDASFPLRFVCTDLDANVNSTESSINKNEASVALEEASKFFMKWPATTWGKRDLRQICFLSPCRGQVTAARITGTREKLPPQVKLVRKIPTYQIQGQEFRALFISTSEPTTADGETKDSTKSISDPSVFITALTRAQSLVVAVGNPFMLLKREKHMVKKYGDLGHCWSLFLKSCIDNGTLSVSQTFDDEASKISLLKQRVTQCVSHIEFPDLIIERDELPPSIKIIPDTPTMTVPSPPAAKNTEEIAELKDHVVKEQLGHGGFGVVCCVQHKIDKKKYALKIVRVQDKPDEQEKVVREVLALADLHHPNIVEYKDSWMERAPPNWKDILPWKHLPSSDSASFASLMSKTERKTGDSESQAQADIASATTSICISSHSSGAASSESSNIVFADTSSSEQRLHTRSLMMQMGSDLQPPMCLCIKTELCDKQTLKIWLRDNKHRQRKEVTTWFMEILEGVKYIHSKSLMHRDLKPSNIFFSIPTPEHGKTIKIGDFGLVTTAQVDLNEAALSHSKYLGTKLYMSPEQNKKEKYGKEIDIYALGIIYFEMNHYFGSDMERCEVIGKLRTSVKVSIAFENELPHEAQIIEWMLTEDPKERPSAEKITLSSKFRGLKKSVKKNKSTISQF